jgi:hypothetical protein
MLLVGSRAAQHYIPGFRDAKDWDFVLPLRGIFTFSVKYAKEIDFLVPQNEWKFKGRLKTGEHFEIEVADYNESTGQLWGSRCDFDTTKPNPEGECLFDRLPLDVVDVEYQMLMKRSHLYWNVHWEKSIADYHELKRHSLKLQRKHQDFLRLRLAENELKWGKIPTVDYDVENAEFFDRSACVGRVFYHDDLHEAVRYYNVPLYLACKSDKTKARLDRLMFELWDDEQKQRLVREEAMVIALERVVIPKTLAGAPVDAQDAYSYALRRLCTNLSSGWFREYAIENWHQLKAADIDYVSKFREHFTI